MRTWTCLVAGVAAAASISAFAQGTPTQGSDDRNKQKSTTTTTGTSGTTGTTGTTGTSGTTGSGTAGQQPTSGNTSTTTQPIPSASRENKGDMSGSGSTSMTAQNDPDLRNLTTERFILRAASSGIKEVQAAELALRSSKDEKIKSFAREMLADHTKQNSQLTTIAAKNNIQVPKDLMATDRSDIETLRSHTGTAFDAAFIQQMQMDHQKAVALFRSCANASKVSSEVRQFCTSQLPTLQEHHQSVQTMKSGTSRTAASEND